MTAQEARDSAVDRENALLIARMDWIDSRIKRAVAKGRQDVWVRCINGQDVIRLYGLGFRCRRNWLCTLFGGAIVSWESRP